MNADEVTEAILRQLLQGAQSVDELTDAWRARHARALEAYEQWCSFPSEAAYTRYRTAQDHADSAQDALHAQHLRGAEATRL